MSTNFLFDGPEDARVTILLAHGAGAPMDSASMNAAAKALAAARGRAELYAKTAGLTVRRIVRISESEGAPPIVRPMAMMAMKRADTTPVEAGEQELTVNLSVVFELN